MKPPKVRAEAVYWRDAHEEGDVKYLAEMPDDYVVKTVGIIIEEGEKFLSIAAEVLPGDDGWRGVTRVPVENVLRREKLYDSPR